MTALQLEHRAPSTDPLLPLPDQPERWNACTNLSFDGAAQLVLDAHARDGHREDQVIHRLNSWAFGSRDGETMELAPLPLPGRRHRGPVALRDLAFNQLSQRLGVPAPYIRKLPPKLAMANMNWALSRHQGSTLFRMADQEVRAVVSERYAAIDDPLVLELVSECLDRAGYRDDAIVRSVATGPHTVLRITLPGEGEPVKVGDVIEYGIDIANSEMGLRSVQVNGVTYRLSCLNGMRSWKSEASMRMRHVGDPLRLRDQLADAIPVAFAEARGDLDLWKRAVDVLIDDALDEIDGLRAFGLSQRDTEAVGRRLLRDSTQPYEETAEGLRDAMNSIDTSAFEVANAITATARDTSSVAGRLALEEVGHRYLSRRAA